MKTLKLFTREKDKITNINFTKEKNVKYSDSSILLAMGC